MSAKIKKYICARIDVFQTSVNRKKKRDKNLAKNVQDGIVIGASVKSGDIIGTVGETAMNEIAEEPHLHYELKVNDLYVDPKEHMTFPSSDMNFEDEITESAN